MDDDRTPRTDATDALARSAAASNEAALAELYGRHRKRLRQMVRLRLDRRLQGRVDPSDVLQEAYLDLAEKLPGYVGERAGTASVPLAPAGRRRALLRVHRQHLGAAMRDAGREVSLYRGDLAAGEQRLAGGPVARPFHHRQPGGRPRRGPAPASTGPEPDGPDRPRCHRMRHFEELSNAETAEVLGIRPQAASSRHIRAMARLQAILKGIPGLLDHTR